MYNISKPALLAMTPDRLGNELRAIVAADVLRHAARQEQIASAHPARVRRDAAIHLQRQTLRVYSSVIANHLSGWPVAVRS